MVKFIDIPARNASYERSQELQQNISQAMQLWEKIVQFDDSLTVSGVYVEKLIRKQQALGLGRG